jgi:hypothetical protein
VIATPAPLAPSATVARRRRSPLLDRSPVFAAFAIAACAFVGWSLWPDVAFLLSSRTAIDLGAPGEYQLDRARPNRLHRVAGLPAASVRAVTTRGGEERTVVGLAGTNLLVDRPGRGVPPAVYEGRLLPRAQRADYAPFVAALRDRGFDAGDRFMVLRDGERPGERWWYALLAVAVLAIAAVNLRALVRRLRPT